MADVEKFKCIDCGAEVEYEGGLAGWAKKNPDKVRCKDCFDKYKSGAKKSFTKGTAKKADEGKAAGCNCAKPKQEIEPKHFKKIYDEMRAEFADELDEVKDYLGGWTTTVLLSRRDNGKLN